MPTARPFHRAVVSDDAFNSTSTFRVHTRWIETEFVNEIPAFTTSAGDAGNIEKRETVIVEVDGRRIEVSLPVGVGNVHTTPKRSMAKKGHSAATGSSLVAPMQGTVVKIAVAEGDVVAEGALVLVVEAMLTRHRGPAQNCL
jgi:acetyl-CoA/propionyl-CoA carboxylase biotin carboxyl carrier protein